MLVITGTGRCGTSVLARFCHNMGYLVGGKWCHVRNAGMEEPTVVAVNKDIIGATNDEKSGQFVNDFSRIVVKDPRFIRPGVLAFWAERRQDIKLLVCVRDLVPMLASLVEMRERVGSPLPQNAFTSIDQVAMTMHAFWRDVARFKVPVSLLPFPEFLTDFSLINDRLRGFGGLSFDRERGRKIWEALANKNSVHHR